LPICPPILTHSGYFQAGPSAQYVNVILSPLVTGVTLCAIKELIVNKKVANFKKPGDAILFRSFLNHEVTPVTKGERITLSYFINGPKSI